jgi:Fe-S cluster biosynthesis and repair protein YggX
LRHSFSHFHLDITPTPAGDRARRVVMEGERFVWYNTHDPEPRGMAAPVQTVAGGVGRMNLLKIQESSDGSNGEMHQARHRGRGSWIGRLIRARLGQRIFANVSKAAWQQWLRQQTMLINEYRLTPFEPKARQFLEEQMEQFFFGEGARLTRGLRSAASVMILRLTLKYGRVSCLNARVSLLYPPPDLAR